MKDVEHISLPKAKAEPRWKRPLWDSVLALGSVALVTGIIFGAQLYPRIPTIVFVYLLIVLTLASIRGLYAAILASLLAVLSFDIFFFPLPYPFEFIDSDDLLTLCIFLAAAIITSQLVSVLRRRAEQARNRERALRLLYEQVQELATLRERQRLASELHDSVSQALYSISLGVHTVRESLEDSEPEQAKASIEYVLALTEAALVEMRAIIFELRPESLETNGLVAALSRQVAVLQARYKLTVEATLADEPDLSLERKHALYRIAQEALHNIIKHAHASTVVLRLVRQEGEIVLEVRDNGRGFDPAGSFPGHLGLHSMQERATKMDAIFTIESTPGQGTSLRVRVPLEAGSA